MVKRTIMLVGFFSIIVFFYISKSVNRKIKI